MAILFLLPPAALLYADEGIIEKDIAYTVVKGDYGGMIEGKLGLEWSHIASSNQIKYDAPLAIGQKINYPAASSGVFNHISLSHSPQAAGNLTQRAD